MKKRKKKPGEGTGVEESTGIEESQRSDTKEVLKEVISAPTPQDEAKAEKVIEENPPSENIADKINKLFEPDADKPYPGGIRHAIHRGKTYVKRDIYKIYYVYTDNYINIVKNITSIIHSFNVRRSQLREDEEKLAKTQNKPFDWNRLYLLFKALREKYAKEVEQVLDNENILSEQAYLFVPLLYNYQDPVYKDVKLTTEEDENIELMETEEVKKGSGYRRRKRRRTRRTTRSRRTKRTRRTRKRRKN